MGSFRFIACTIFPAASSAPLREAGPWMDWMLSEKNWEISADEWMFRWRRRYSSTDLVSVVIAFLDCQRGYFIVAFSFRGCWL